MNEMNKIFLDLDGTLARFNVKNALKRFDKEEGFFSNLLAYKGIEIVNELAKTNQLFIISASPNEQADKDKMIWLIKYLPNIKIENINFNNEFLQNKFYNISDQLIKPDSGVTLDIETKNPDIAIAEYYDRSKKWYLYGNKSGATDVTATVTLPDGNILNKEYTLVFKYNQEIDYEEYYEPNVKHILVKTADNFDLLSANTDYLLLNELVWCIGDNSLYFKAQSSTGAIGLFKINGGGVTPTPTPPSPTGTTISFEIADNGILDIEDKSTNKQISITEEGILELVGTFDGDTLILNNSGESKGEIKIEGDDLVITNVTVSEDGIIDFGDLTVDDEGYIIMN